MTRLTKSSIAQDRSCRYDTLSTFVGDVAICAFIPRVECKHPEAGVKRSQNVLGATWNEEDE
jgi:hypothetical protein